MTIPSERDAFTALLRRHWALDAWRTNGATVEDARRTQMRPDGALEGSKKHTVEGSNVTQRIHNVQHAKHVQHVEAV